MDPYKPCPFPPGSVAKMEWMALRVALELPAYHPDDSPHVPPAHLARASRGDDDED